MNVKQLQYIQSLKAQGYTNEQIKALILSGTTQQPQQSQQPDQDGDSEPEATQQEMNFDEPQPQEQNENQQDETAKSQDEEPVQDNSATEEKKETEETEEKKETEETEEKKEESQAEREEDEEPAEEDNQEDDPIIKKLKMYIKLNIPIYLAGPAGCGKSYSVRKAAEALNLDFYMDNQIQISYDVKGHADVNGNFVETEFYRAFTRGGVYFLDEIDSSCPDALVALNNAIANKYFVFPVLGRIQAHKNFRVVAAGNTVGTGADEMYTGRQRLDAATLNRFCVINCNYNPVIETRIGGRELMLFVRELREIYKRIEKQAVISYRQIEYIKRAEEAAAELSEVIYDILFSTENPDDFEQIKFQLPRIKNNRYAAAAYQITI